MPLEDNDPVASNRDPVSRLRSLRDALLDGLVERDMAVRLTLLAVLAGEHILLVGPPGTAKSHIAGRLRHAFEDAVFFERLLTRFTVPEELFGPLSIKGLEEDRYERLTAAYLPTATVAFLDEIFKANSAILNSLLTLLNERKFDNGTRREDSSLKTVVGASNELVEGEELAALFDRFLLRLHVGPVSKGGFAALIGLRQDGAIEVDQALKLTDADLRVVRGMATKVTMSDDVLALLSDLREWCAAEGIKVSDRRWLKVVHLLCVSAVTNGRASVSVWDCWLLQHCLWEKPEQRAKVYDWYSARVGASKAMDPASLTKIVVAMEAQLKRDKDSRSQQIDGKGQLIFKGVDGKLTVSSRGPVRAYRESEPLYLSPSGAKQLDQRQRSWVGFPERTNNGKGFTAQELDEIRVEVPGDIIRFGSWGDRARYLVEPSNWLTVEGALTPEIGPTQHKPEYVDARLREIDDLRREVVAYQSGLDLHIASMEREIRTHLWVTEDFAKPAAQTLDKTKREVEALLRRVDELRKGFEMLPRDTSATSLTSRTK